MERPSGITEIKMGAALLCFISAELNLVKLQLRSKKKKKKNFNKTTD